MVFNHFVVVTVMNYYPRLHRGLFIFNHFVVLTQSTKVPSEDWDTICGKSFSKFFKIMIKHILTAFLIFGFFSTNAQDRQGLIHRAEARLKSLNLVDFQRLAFNFIRHCFH